MTRRIAILAMALTASIGLFAQTEVAKLAGEWNMSVDTPHGKVVGPLKMEQDGVKLTGTYDVEHMGTFPLTGTVDGKKISIEMKVPNSDVAFVLTGEIDGAKLGGSTSMGGSWSATRK